MSAPVAAVVLAAGLGTRLRPLTNERPKPLCPVGNVPLLDRMLAHLATLGLRGPHDVAVNTSWLADQVVAHATGRAHLSVEPERPLGTGGGLAHLRPWISGRAVLAANADAYLAGGTLTALLDDWDGHTVRLLGVPGAAGEPGTFSGFRFAGLSLMPWRWIRDLPPEPDELVKSVWRPAEAAGELQVVPYRGDFHDTGTIARYLAANLHAAAAAGGLIAAPQADITGTCAHAVIGAGAVVRGRLTRSVLWPGARVGPDEHLIDAVRTDTGLTVTAARSQVP